MAMKNKVCIVTGASSGLGASIAILFAKEGASVLLCGRNNSRLQEVLTQCVEASGGRKELFATAAGDMNNASDRVQACEKAVKTFGKIDVLVPCAGMLPAPSTFSLETEERYDLAMNTNLKSVFFLVQAAESELEKSKGSVVVISSTASKMHHAGHIIYGLSKAALDFLCQSLALTLGPKGIRVNTVNPTYVKTRILRNFFEDERKEVYDLVEKEISQFHPLYGRCGTPEEVAQAVLFFAGEDSKYVTGQRLGVDGGVPLVTAVYHNSV